MESDGQLRVVGAGVGRTGTNSLKLALERLLGGPCYHMFELIQRPEQTEAWHRAICGEEADWSRLLGGFVATVDWPACAFWRDLAQANPEAPVLLSTRESAGAWWASMEDTIVSMLESPVPEDDPEWQARRAMTTDLMLLFVENIGDRQAAIDAYERHNAAVRAEVAPERLIDWQPGDGWEPICAGLGVPVPAEPFPHVNRGDEFRARAEMD